MDRVVDASERWLPSSQEGLKLNHLGDISFGFNWMCNPHCTCILVSEAYVAVAKFADNELLSTTFGSAASRS
jgi:hypothetical protein